MESPERLSRVAVCSWRLDIVESSGNTLGEIKEQVAMSRTTSCYVNGLPECLHR